MVLQAIRYNPGRLEILDQLRLPHEESFVHIKNPQDGWNAIKSMQVRGAPAIAIVAALSLAVCLSVSEYPRHDKYNISVANFISLSLKYLVTSRPTAVNLLDAAKKLGRVARDAQMQSGSTDASVRDAYVGAAEAMLVNDVNDNESIGRCGADWILQHCAREGSPEKLSVLTHCNTGSLATAGFGTALGVVRSLSARGILQKAFYTETRPYNQGARLTGFELIHDGIDAELITDSMAAALLSLRKESDNIACVVVGADRVAANGDTANKIGTYSLAILAKWHGIRFLVAAPRTTIDLDTSSGAKIKIEQRSMQEVTTLKGPQITRASDATLSYGSPVEIGTAAARTKAWNPSFDVTPAVLIDGIITEKGVIERSVDGAFHFDPLFDSGPEARPTSINDITESEKSSWQKIVEMRADDIPSWDKWLVDNARSTISL